MRGARGGSGAAAAAATARKPGGDTTGNKRQSETGWARGVERGRKCIIYTEKIKRCRHQSATIRTPLLSLQENPSLSLSHSLSCRFRSPRVLLSLSICECGRAGADDATHTLTSAALLPAGERGYDVVTYQEAVALRNVFFPSS